MNDVHSLGPMWVSEVKSFILEKRNKIAAMASRCQPDGDYRKQMEMVIVELDMMIAAPELLAALQGALEVIEGEFGLDSIHCQAARAAIQKATGEPV